MVSHALLSHLWYLYHVRLHRRGFQFCLSLLTAIPRLSPHLRQLPPPCLFVSIAHQSHSMVRLSAVVIVLARRREHLQFASVRNLYSSRLQQSSLVAISPRAISKSVADYSGSLPISAPTPWLVDHAISVGLCKGLTKVSVSNYCILKKFCVWNAEPTFYVSDNQTHTKRRKVWFI